VKGHGPTRIARSRIALFLTPLALPIYI